MSDAKPKRVYVIVAPTGMAGHFVAEVIDAEKSRPGRPVVLHRATTGSAMDAKIDAVGWAKMSGYEIMDREEAAREIRRMMGR